MKICKKCAARQSDDRTTCIDCGTVLGNPIDDGEEAALNEELSHRLTDMSERADDFYVSKTAKVCGILSIVLAVAMVIVLNWCTVQKNRLKPDAPTGLSGDVKIVAVYSDGTAYDTSTGELVSHPDPTSSAIEQLEKASVYALIALVCLIPSALCLLFPKAMWFLSTMRYRLWFDMELTPSWLAASMDRLFKYGFFLIGCFCSAGSFFHLL